MADSDRAAAILKRALAYPYATPERSYLYRDGEAHELPEGGPDLTGRTPLLSYGANSAPEALAWKLASLPGQELPVLRAELENFDVVYSAHVSPYGAVPATLIESPGPAVLERVRAQLRPEMSLQEFVLDCVERGGIRPLRIGAVPPGR